jgi:hypothetical protein
LTGTIGEQLVGDLASRERYYFRTSTREADQVRPIEARLYQAMADFSVTSAEASGQADLEEPLGWRYSVVARSYARRAGELLTLRPRVVGNKAEPLPDSETPRVHDLEFSEARVERDEISIRLPAGYVVDSMPDPVDLDVGFAAYRSASEVSGDMLRYVRTYEIRELRAPAARADDYRRLHQAIARDERAVVVLKRAAP